MQIDSDNYNICVHCGDVCRESTVIKDGNYYCCSGCLFVYELLNDSEIQKSYDISQLKSLAPKPVAEGEYDYLDQIDIKDKLVQFSINGKSKVILYLPNIYCSACVWLLENITKIDHGILESKVNFLKKEISILYDENQTSLKKIVSLLASIGYKPRLDLSSLEQSKPANENRSLIIKIGIAGFCFANIMLFALPDYLSGGNIQPDIKIYLRFLSFFASIPVLYAASDYFRTAIAGIKAKIISIDLPLSIGILALFSRSCYEVLSFSGSGYSDSLAGLVFFLLLGKIFQKKTFYNLSFDRDYKSYFPITVLKKKNDKEETIPVQNIKVGDVLIIRNNELVPVDSILIGKEATLDYSFVTGESKPVIITVGDKIYSGAKHLGATIEVRVQKDFKQSYMTELWNNGIIKGNQKDYNSRLSNAVAKYFSLFVLIVALTGFLIWLPTDINRSWSVFVAVLIVACPCAIALSIPFSYGTALRIFSKYKFYLKNDKVVEYLKNADTIIFDKTGTLTETDKSYIDYSGSELSDNEKSLIKSTVRNSTHPYSRLIYNYFKENESFPLNTFREVFGKGIEATVGNNSIKVGNKNWIELEKSNILREDDNLTADSEVYIKINEKYSGKFSIKSKYRGNIFEMIKALKENYRVVILSGDSPTEKKFIEDNIGGDIQVLFEQKPFQKPDFVNELQKNGNRIIMVGDGLNDAGALLKADVGIAVAENTSNFTPGSDAILDAESLKFLPKFLKLSKKTVITVYLSYSISFLYNLIGFGFAFAGLLAPVVAAILMPLSSISVVLFTVGTVNFNEKKLKID